MEYIRQYTSTTYQLKHEQLEYLLPLKVSNAKFRTDAHRLFTKIEGLVKNDTIRPLLEVYRIGTGTEGIRNGRACFLGLKEYHQGKQQNNVKLFEAQEALKVIHWTNFAAFMAENYMLKLLDYFNIIDKYSKPWSEDKKNRHFHQTL